MAVQLLISSLLIKKNVSNRMKISVAQNRPLIGNLDANIKSHEALVELAVSHGSALVIFPELSLPGYEPKIAAQVATTVEDPRFSSFQRLSDKHNIVIGAGMPIENENGITITMILFQPGQPRRTYSKKYLHEDEEPFFVSGENFPGFTVNDTRVALAICYEISIPEHVRDASKTDPVIYIASVAKFKRHMEKTIATLVETAKNYSMIVMMANCLGLCDGEECAGGSCAIDANGLMMDQLDDIREGVLTLDLQTNEIFKKSLSKEIHHL
jgi:predicted amidohydrolase